MKISGRDQLDRFCIAHADCRSWIENWIADTESSQWHTPQDIKNRYSSASFLAESIVIFNVRGNAYRLVTNVAYRTGVVFVKWIGTHPDYEKKYG